MPVFSQSVGAPGSTNAFGQTPVFALTATKGAPPGSDITQGQNANTNANAITTEHCRSSDLVRAIQPDVDGAQAGFALHKVHFASDAADPQPIKIVTPSGETLICRPAFLSLNSGSFVLEGTLNNTEGVIFRSAAPGPGGVGGGLPEVFVPNPATQININRVSGVNPPF